MSRIANAFQKKAKIAYLTAGDGNSVDYFLALVRGGANILEIGIPFSDPIADGPVIQRAMERSLKRGTNIKFVLEIVRQIRSQSDVAMILFTYFNPICKDVSGFLGQAQTAGIDGVLVVDLPLEESIEFRKECKKRGMISIAIAAPSTPLQRISHLTEANVGFLYYACRKGTTGERDNLPADVMSKISEIRAQSCLPVAIGFGIAHRQAAMEAMKMADGCVVGSCFVSAIERGSTAEELEKLAQEIFYVD